MSDSGSQITLKQLLSRHQRIQIPMIQRDYAQGRPGAEDVREEFLGSLQQAFALAANDGALPLNLDFIYGSVDIDGPARFLPLDGQQRLTTLFLLHWYLAWRDGCQAEFRQVFCEGAGSRFSYSVRPSSAEFFDELVNFWPAREAADGSSLTGLITNQAWYFRYWRLDPTIQSCLTMLEAIHQRFADITGAYARLMDEQQPVITFQLLDLDHFGLSDDLYIKMNARGKPLTAFETFKARYEHELKGQFGDETREISGQAFTVADYFARRMDTGWADFFWAYRDRETHLYDDAIMNFFHAVAFICRDPESSGYLEEISTFRSKPLKSAYALYHKGGWLEREFSATLMLLLEIWGAKDNRFTPLLPDNPYFNEAAMFQRLVSDPAALAYTDLVQLFAYVAFLRAAGEQAQPQALLEWMRVIYNLSINSSYERPADMQRSLLAVQSLLPHVGDILGYFANNEKPTTGFHLQQVSEEQLKAELLLAHSGWRELIERAEKHGYFKGQIEFLLEFSGAVAKRRKAGLEQWVPGEHLALQQHFSRYLDKAEKMFSARGLNSLADFRWERALLSLGDYLLPSGYNYSFLVNSASEQASWKRLLRGGAGENVQEARTLLQKLMEQIDLDAPLEGQLDELIANAEDLEPWRQIMVDTPAVFRYCGEHALRWDGDHIYLLKKSRMSGMHAELFSYHLFTQLKAEQLQKKLLPLRQDEYQTVSGSEFEPTLNLALTFRGCSLYFRIFSFSGRFRIQVSRKTLKSVPDLEKLLAATFKFDVQKEAINLDVTRERIHITLRAMARAIKAVEVLAADTL
ncbi:DUF262 domain-containing protein [Pseudomonas alliivorans]|nr:DUF262 domain-containing protein [Pseudomonas alliivorans]MEE4712357.1 DUF262 domain-containing protein [Pseudomonas alliivorans]MEE4727577.1 DUF262 domain-containing protein [Pseudomonas alliivorans]MEE4767525.1 DUF262 domain-containing protein [Pseudomonas alliivorans]